MNMPENDPFNLIVLNQFLKMQTAHHGIGHIPEAKIIRIMNEVLVGNKVSHQNHFLAR